MSKLPVRILFLKYDLKNLPKAFISFRGKMASLLKELPAIESEKTSFYLCFDEGFFYIGNRIVGPLKPEDSSMLPGAKVVDYEKLDNGKTLSWKEFYKQRSKESLYEFSFSTKANGKEASLAIRQY